MHIERCCLLSNLEQYIFTGILQLVYKLFRIVMQLARRIANDVTRRQNNDNFEYFVSVLLGLYFVLFLSGTRIQEYGIFQRENHLEIYNYRDCQVDNFPKLNKCS